MLVPKLRFTLFFSVIVVFFINACSTTPDKHPITNIQSQLDSLQLIYSPDKRTSLWDISIINKDDEIVISGELDNVNTFREIKDFLSKNYNDIANEIELLPKDNYDQFVNGVINNSVANLRSNPRHSAEIATQALLGTPVRILKRENGWYLLQTPNKYLAWVDAMAAKRIDKKALEVYKNAKKIIYNKQYGFSYSEPNEKSQTVTDLVSGCILPIISDVKGYYQVKYPDNRMAWVKKDEVVDAYEIFYKNLNKESIVTTARKFTGIPYLWGGTSSKAIDCSGFTSSIYYMNGILLQRDASQQIHYGEKITTKYNYESLHAGDLLFFKQSNLNDKRDRITHVAMYIGDSEFIHASGRVRINSMDSLRDNFIPSYVHRFISANRIIGEKDGIGIEQLSENKFYKEIIK